MHFLRRITEYVSKPWCIFLIALVVYSGMSSWLTQKSLFAEGPVNYYMNLADAFLQGHVDVNPLAHPTGFDPFHDLSIYKGKFYLYWPPVPAFIFAILKLIFGVRIGDVFVTLIFGALNVMLLAKLFERLEPWGMTNKVLRSLLLLGFAFGTVHLTLSVFGRVWFTGQIIGLFFVLLTYLAAFSTKKTRLAAIALGTFAMLATLTRYHLLFAVVPAFYIFLAGNNGGAASEPRRPFLVRNTALILIPLMIGFAFSLWYNYARFDSIFDTGFHYQNMSREFTADLAKHGGFSLAYFAKNFYYMYLAYPFPISNKTWWGASLFLLSPFLFAACFAFAKEFKKHRKILYALTVGIILVNIPLLLTVGTGWFQFGSRYTLDFLAPLMILVALGASKLPSRAIAFLVLLSIIQFVYGTEIVSHRFSF